MMAVHEFGHVAGAIATGGRVEGVVLHPLTISRTDVSPNPCALIVVWAGPIIGALLPIQLFLATRGFKWTFLLQFFAGFCLIANGAYIGIGSFGKIGDAGDMLCPHNCCSENNMLRHGSPMWPLWLFGAVCFPWGLYLWNGLGPHFGLGTAAGKVDHRAAYVCCGILLLTVLAEVALSSK